MMQVGLDGAVGDRLGQLSAAVAAIAVQPAQPSWAKSKLAGQEDAIEIASRDPSSSWAGYMRYVDVHGEVSERRIVCRVVEGYGRAETIGAYCCERKSNRRFRIDRIEELICLQTGELVNPATHFDQMRLHGALRVLDKTLSDFGRALVFMARCDGAMHPLEMDAVEEGMGRYVLRYGGDDDDLARALKGTAQLAPDGPDLVNALVRIERHPDAKQVARLMLNCMEKVTVADGHLHADEIEWGGLVQQHLIRIVG